MSLRFCLLIQGKSFWGHGVGSDHTLGSWVILNFWLEWQSVWRKVEKKVSQMSTVWDAWCVKHLQLYLYQKVLHWLIESVVEQRQTEFSALNHNLHWNKLTICIYSICVLASVRLCVSLCVLAYTRAWEGEGRVRVMCFYFMIMVHVEWNWG